jgi:hypothetical protein
MQLGHKTTIDGAFILVSDRLAISLLIALHFQLRKSNSGPDPIATVDDERRQWTRELAYGERGSFVRLRNPVPANGASSQSSPGP